MDQSQMLSIIGGFYDKLVSDVSNVVISRLSAAGAAQITMDSDEFKQAVRTMLEDDSGARDTIRDLVTDAMDNYDLTDNDDFKSMAAKVDELEEVTVDADNDNFADAVRSVIRNHI